jgi:ubiquitin C-terminal hydrolase
MESVDAGVRGKRGLQNLGNTCYANASIQCLAHCIPVAIFFLQKKHEETLNSSDNAIVTAEWEKLLNAIWTSGSIKPIAPVSFMKSLQRLSDLKRRKDGHGTVFRIGQQHDMVEFIQFFLDSVHESMKINVAMDIKGNSKNYLDKLMIESLECFKSHYHNDYSIVVDLFGGQYFTRILTCDSKGPLEHSANFDPFTVLTLDMPVGCKDCTLMDCLDLMIRPELIEGWRGLDQERDIEKSTYLWKLPVILVIHLKRFRNRFMKNDCRVNFEETLCLREYCQGYDRDNSNFKLVSVGNHYGCISSGHYTAYCRNVDQKWYHFDDRDCSPIEFGSIDHSAAYCLFYMRAKDER